MTDKRDVKLAKKAREKQFEQVTVAYTGKIISRNGSVHVPGILNHVWVLPTDESEPEAVYNRTVKDTRPDLPVVVGYFSKSTVLEILRTDVEHLAGYAETGGLDVPNHGATHRSPKAGGEDPTWVDRDLIIDQLYLSPGSGLAVNISPYEYDSHLTGARVYFPGQLNYSIAAHKPAAGLALYVLIYLDTADNTIKAVAGATSPDLGWLIPAKPNTPEGGVTAGYVRLDGAAVNIGRNDIDQGRRLWLATRRWFNDAEGNPAAVGPTAADGTSVYAARRDHVHTIDITAFTEETTAADTDEVLVSKAGAHRRMSRANLLAGVSGGSDTLTVKNTSGGAVVAGDAGYTDSAGEYKETTTFGLENVDWCVVVTGGANNSDIEVARAGLRDVAFAGTIPTVGNYVYTSTTAGLAEDMGAVWPGVFGIVKDVTGWASAGDTAQVLLYCNRTPFSKTGSSEILRVNLSSPSDFVATIAAAGVSGDKVYYNAPSSGALNTITPTATTQLAKIILHNFSRTEDSRIIAVGTDGTGNYIQVSAAGDIAAWTSGNTITARSQLVTNPSPPPYYYSLEITSSEIPLLTTALDIDVAIVDAGAGQLFLHPWLTYNSAATFGASSGNGANTAGIARRGLLLPIIERRLTFATFASGAAAATIVLRLMGGVRASP